MSYDSPAPFPGGLRGLEVYWHERYEWLNKAGYQLRPRYRPDWVPSWQASKKSRWDVEDGVTVEVGRIMDAVMTKDGTIVVIKRIQKSVHPLEGEIGRFLSSPPLNSDPRNHCCPILDVLDDPEDADVQLIVMPLLREYDDPKLTTVGEAMELFRQLFECLQFIHEQHVAHRDISKLNLMMDSRPILPDSFHPQSTGMTRDFKHWVSPRSRTVYPVKYYLTDFGLSRRYSAEEANPLEIPIFGGDRSVPEFQEDRTIPRNPFHTDIYYAGNLVRQYFMQVYTNLTFLEPLIFRMVQDEPSKRPNMDEVVKSFKEILSKQSARRLRERLVERQDSAAVNFLKDMHHVCFRTVPFWLTRRCPLPSPKT
ncbi:hypothetical protein L226DRAFT_503286 [Lentinus tigrinus ALCF2SS1-7]|uniref:Protein kinase domain-containing protein n=1 Tax=Lentinus tigrinus ALCF2SS1-6 TaxID=1328759 RepID=A0A5C2RRS5_9APHY|nr:hypothetical protein L227DRAFT_536318 [Lentinus tigrinus ALCF2SS1-6]RPD78660.1 hypothetical protein L226DRAFT_503286 [Lentinus tigrinus ALCF2SS1-7]